MNSEVPPKTGLTVAEFDQLVADMVAKKKLIEELEEVVKDHNKQLAEMKAKAILVLKERNCDSYKCSAATISVLEKWSVPTPKTDEEKKAFFDYLEEKGLFLHYATINSNSLMSYFLTEREIAAKEGVDPLTFRLPGIGEAKLYESVSIRASKS